MSFTAEDRLGSHAGRVTDPNPEVPERAKRRSYTAKYKLEILAEYKGLDREGKDGPLRREGCIRRFSRSGVNNATGGRSKRWRRSRVEHRSIR